MNKKQKTAIITVASFFAFFTTVLFVQPFLRLREGSFLWASLYGLHDFAIRTVGFAPEILGNFSLLPFVLLSYVLLFDALRCTSLVISLLHPVCFLTLLLIQGKLSGKYEELPDMFLFVSIFINGFSCLMIAFEKVLLLRNRVKPVLTLKTPEKPVVSKENLTVEQARQYLFGTVVPDYGTFPMVSIHDEEATIGGSVNSDIYNVVRQEAQIIAQNRELLAAEEAEHERLKEIFKPKNLTKKLMEDRMAQAILPKSVESTTAPVKHPVVQESKETIVDEGTPSEDMDDSRYTRLNDNTDGLDMISGVAGLASAKEGRRSFLINADKYRYKYPPANLLKHYDITARKYEDKEHDPDGITIVETLRQFRIETQLIDIQHGPTFTLYELQLAPGIRVNSVQNYADNLAMNLAVSGVRILAPIPGKVAIGIEVPNKSRDTIGFDVMYRSLSSKQLKIPFVLGRTITGDSVVIDLAGTPHLLIAGTTGSGKSVCVNSLICSVLYTKTPAEVRMLLVDPKMVELSGYNGIPHLLTPVITQPKRVIKAMTFIVEEMERRMQIFKNCGVKKIEDYNRKIEEKAIAAVKLPYIMVIIDEFADLMMVVGKELESYIQRITQIARFTGIHLVLATQRPSVDVITGIIKSNIPSRIAFAVSDVTNSKIIIDRGGAEKLLGRGDMLYLGSTSPEPMRIQGAYIDPEIESIVEYVKKNGEPDYIDESYFEEDDEDSSDGSDSVSSGSEDMFTKAWRLVSEKGEASASYLQRKLNIGYNRAATLIEKLEEAQYIGPARGSKPREILRNYIPQEFDD